MWEYFVTEYEYAINRNNYICNYVRNFGRYKKIKDKAIKIKSDFEEEEMVCDEI